jgi:UDPglucose--hexose-1-phosphate uridylyltransferase
VSGLPNCTIEGFGIQEVIVETPNHSLTTALLPDAHVATILRAAKTRLDDLSGDSRIAHATIFKNHAVGVRTGLEHSHCQLVTTTEVSPYTASLLQQALRHYHRFRECVFCSVVQEELDAKTRIVMVTEHFVALEPFASATPFCTHIYPRRHMANFGDTRADEINDFAQILRGVLAKLYFGLENPDFSYIIRTAPVASAGILYYHWYLSIVPRLSSISEFDLGSGMLINTVMPEAAAEFLREVRVEQAIPA